MTVERMTSGETRLVNVDFGDSNTDNVQSGKLRSGELLTGTPTVTQQSSTPADATAATLANKQLNTVAIKLNHEDGPRTAAISEAVQFTVAALDNGADYVFKVACGTDGSPAQTLEHFVVIECRDG